MATGRRHQILVEPVQIGPETLRNRFYLDRAVPRPHLREVAAITPQMGGRQ